MARRLVVLPSSSGMALVLLLVVAVVLLSNGVPSSANASADESSEETTTTTTTDSSSSSSSSSSSGGDAASSSTSSPDQATDSSSSSNELGSSSSSTSSSPEKQKERQVAKEKAVAAEKAVQQELLKFSKEKHIVSPTNGTGSYKGIAREFLDAQNQVRARYGVPPIKWDKKMARLARRWSNAMRTECKLKHSGIKGQSVFVSHDDWNATATDAVHEWGKEEAMYDKDTEKCKDGRDFKLCGHFALMVKKRSTKVGCARAECFKGGVFITCNYSTSDLNKQQDKNNSKEKEEEEKEKEKEKEKESSN